MIILNIGSHFLLMRVNLCHLLEEHFCSTLKKALHIFSMCQVIYLPRICPQEIINNDSKDLWSRKFNILL